VTIRTEEPKVPANFPPARLFLDDIEEIIRILRESLETVKMDSRSTIEDLRMKVRFSTGGKNATTFRTCPRLRKATASSASR